jgi:hypothetical protein
VQAAIYLICDRVIYKVICLVIREMSCRALNAIDVGDVGKTKINRYTFESVTDVGKMYHIRHCPASIMRNY